MRIYKFPLEITDRQIVAVKGHMRFLSVINQYDRPVVYFEMDEAATETVNYEVRIIGTGNHSDLPQHMTFWGTVPTHGGQLVWHVFGKIWLEAVK